MPNYKNTLLSTSALAKRLELAPRALFQLLQEKGWIERVDNQWRLSGKGQFEGGDYVSSKKYGEYIGWPESILDHKIFAELFHRPLRTRVIASELGISAHRFNALLVERGWQRRFHRGWVLTEAGRKQGGIESEDEEMGVPFTLWPRAILEQSWLAEAIDVFRIAEQQLVTLDQRGNTESAGDAANNNDNDNPQPELDLAQVESLPKCPTLDGHDVAHAEDALICNWLYTMDVTHSYRYKLAVADIGAADFYIPVKQLFIEVWHRDEQGSAMSQKLKRLEYYKSQQYNFIEISQEEVLDLDRLLPKALLKQGITVF